MEINKISTLLIHDNNNILNNILPKLENIINYLLKTGEQNLLNIANDLSEIKNLLTNSKYCDKDININQPLMDLNLKKTYYSENMSKMYDNGRFTGDIINKKREGKGSFFFKNGDVYNGDWKNDKIEGYGVYQYKNGEKYEGEFKDNKKMERVL